MGETEARDKEKKNLRGKEEGEADEIRKMGGRE